MKVVQTKINSKVERLERQLSAFKGQLGKDFLSKLLCFEIKNADSQCDEIAQILITKGADINSLAPNISPLYKKTIFMDLCESGTLKSILTLLKYPHLEINSVDKENDNCLFYLLKRKNQLQISQAIKKVFSKDSSMQNSVRKNGNSLLMEALKNKLFLVFYDLLLDESCDVNYQNPLTGNTILHECVYQAHEISYKHLQTCIELLGNMGMNQEVRNNSNQTAFEKVQFILQTKNKYLVQTDKSKQKLKALPKKEKIIVSLIEKTQEMTQETKQKKNKLLIKEEQNIPSQKQQNQQNQQKDSKKESQLTLIVKKTQFKTQIDRKKNQNKQEKNQVKEERKQLKKKVIKEQKKEQEKNIEQKKEETKIQNKDPVQIKKESQQPKIKNQGQVKKQAQLNEQKTQKQKKEEKVQKKSSKKIHFNLIGTEHNLQAKKWYPLKQCEWSMEGDDCNSEEEGELMVERSLEDRLQTLNYQIYTYSAICQTRQEYAKYEVGYLLQILTEIMQEQSMKIVAYGSIRTGLWFQDSDINLALINQNDKESPYNIFAKLSKKLELSEKYKQLFQDIWIDTSNPNLQLNTLKFAYKKYDVNIVVYENLGLAYYMTFKMKQWTNYSYVIKAAFFALKKILGNLGLMGYNNLDAYSLLLLLYHCARLSSSSEPAVLIYELYQNLIKIRKVSQKRGDEDASISQTIDTALQDYFTTEGLFKSYDMSQLLNRLQILKKIIVYSSSRKILQELFHAQTMFEDRKVYPVEKEEKNIQESQLQEKVKNSYILNQKENENEESW